MANEIFCLCWNAHQNSVWQAIESLLQSEILVDCTISAEGQAIKAHKIILCACSPYLESLLREHPDSHPIIILNGIPFSDLKNLTEFMYRGEISLKKKDLARFIKSAQALKIKGLSKELSEICSDLSTETKRNKSKADEDETRPSEKKKKNDGAEFKQPKVDSPNSECVDSDRDVAESLLVPKSELPSDPDQSEPERCTQLEEMEEYEPLPTNTSTSETEGPIPEENMEQTWEPEAGTSNGVNDTLPDISGDKLIDVTGSSDKFTLIVLDDGYSVLPDEGGCEKRTETIETPTEFEPATETIADGNLSWTCNICYTEFGDNNSLRKHIKRRHSVDHTSVKDSDSHPYQCQKCGETFRILKALKVHELWECGNEAKFQCNICGKQFHLERYLKQHVTKHVTNMSKCQELDIMNLCRSCGKVFKHQTNLENHQKYECGIEPKFECEMCDIQFHFKAQLNEHLLSFHTEASVHNPPLPTTETGFEEDLKYHCELCPRAFTRIGSLNYHVSRKHSGKSHQTERDPLIYPFVCSSCGNRYKNSTQLCRHRRWECGKEPLFQCTQCVKKFHHRHGLKQHIRLHLAKNAQQKPSLDFYCDKCGKGYKLKSSLNNHTKWECGKEPVFACTVCCVKFSHKGNLKKHILTKHINKH